MSTIVRTQNSVYEIDYANSRVRRLEGVRPPTPYQGEDTTWRTYQACLVLHDGSLMFIWPMGDLGDRDLDETVTVRTTITSPVRESTVNGVEYGQGEPPEEPPDSPWPGHPGY